MLVLGSFHSHGVGERMGSYKRSCLRSYWNWAVALFRRFPEIFFFPSHFHGVAGAFREWAKEATLHDAFLLCVLRRARALLGGLRLRLGLLLELPGVRIRGRVYIAEFGCCGVWRKEKKGYWFCFRHGRAVDGLAGCG